MVPFIETDLNLTSRRLTLLMSGLTYIIPCQSRFSRKPLKDIVQTAFQRIAASVKECLGNNQMSITDERAKKAFAELEQIVSNLYSKPLSRNLGSGARKSLNRTRGIRCSRL